jgi:hypothetical protein
VLKTAQISGILNQRSFADKPDSNASEGKEKREKKEIISMLISVDCCGLDIRRIGADTGSAVRD